MEPITRIEKYLSEIENGGKDVPVPVTRIEHYLYEIAQNGGGGFVAQSSAPSDTSLLWIDTSDNTIDETLANADTSSY